MTGGPADRAEEPADSPSRGPARFIVAPVARLGRNDVQLFLTSLAILFVELLLIRWIPANVVYVGYFSNLILMASFLGIGVGILIGRTGWRPRIAPFAIVLLAVVLLVRNAQLNLQLTSPDDIYFGLADEEHAADVNFLVLPLIFMLATAVMASLALPLGGLLRSLPPLRAYAVDISGSLVGIVAFAVLSALGTTPAVWFLVVAGVLLLSALGRGLTAWSAVGGAAMVAIVAVALVQGDLWSPYQRLTVLQTPESVSINANGVPHQGFFLSPTKDQGLFYTQVDRWFPGHRWDRVLIVGAGSGNDTAAALARGASSVDAVEIDPFLQQIGIDLHPLHPYQDPRVHRTVDDGRAFLRRSNERYDLIVFALPDSLTLVSSTAGLRLESFLFTTEAFTSVRDHLAPGGIFVLYNFYRQPWLLQKLESMLQASFGGPPIVHVYGGLKGTAAVLAAGPAVAALNGGPPPGDVVDPVDTAGAPAPATDDWPFLYLRDRGITNFYLVALALVLGFAAILLAGVIRLGGGGIRRFSPHFFVLGIAFLLLETRSLVTFSLLFGSTWIVNALVFFGILVSVLAAVGVNLRVPIRDPRPLYAALLVVLGLGYVLPPEALLLEPAWLRYVIAAVLTFAPVFVANLVFSLSFRDTRTADMAFASNLLGAMVGGAVEYVALITGYQALLLVVAALYLLAYLLASRVRLLADRDLAREPLADPIAAPAGVALVE